MVIYKVKELVGGVRRAEFADAQNLATRVYISTNRGHSRDPHTRAATSNRIAVSI